MTGEGEGGLPVYRWMSAPAHLKTRRQLRAQGLTPGRQDIAATMERPRRRRKPLVAHLFDITKAVPRRTATPAQREALAAANRARQIEAARRRGISLTDPAEFAAAHHLHAGAAAARIALQDCRIPADLLAATDIWRGQPPTAETAAAYLAEAPARRDQLDARLLDPAVPGAARRDAALILSYLEGRDPRLDLLHTHILIDPVDAARGRVDRLLTRFATHGTAFGPALAAETSALPEADQRRVRAATDAVLAGKPHRPLWPQHIDRSELTTRLHGLARTPLAAREAKAEALLASCDGHGLHPLEHHRLLSICQDALTSAPVPVRGLLLLDERSKQRFEAGRHTDRAIALGSSVFDQVTALLADHTDIRRPRAALRAVSDDIAWLARGHHTRAELGERRNLYYQHLTRLHQHLIDARVPRGIREESRDLLDTALHTAARAARTRDQRERAWRERLYPNPAAISHRLLAASTTRTQRERSPEQAVPHQLPDLAPEAGPAAEVTL
ncbi:RRQRL motif-containing zinc-binding protein [Nocardia yamanashiensis]|uniref:RRQRL motif-containing zinc-binding protein n=1 Tax=Nocardia yamanashiensis TaxID=209247 RepID=UPI0012FE3301|nr:RRQRL motif-containing zinc-binding protein [Nocardia yamanashiensis]